MGTGKDDEVLVVRKMLESGYQVELDVVRQLLDQEGEPGLVIRILESAAKMKGKRRTGQFVITLKDVRPFLRLRVDQTSMGQVAPDYEIVFDPTGAVSPTLDASGYVQLFRSRLSKMSSMMRNRPDFFQVERLNAIKTPTSGKKVLAKVTGLVVSKKASAEYVSLTLEDESGYLRLMCTDDAIRKAEDVLIDEFVLVEVESLPRGYYARNVFHPDVPERARRTSATKVYAMFASDLHVGSPSFDEGAFRRLISWLNGDLGELEIVSKTAYLVLNGDLIENPLARDGHLNEQGVEVYYDVLSERLAGIRRNVKVFIVPGETDATRMALPQPAVMRKYAKKLYGMRNVVMLGNPSMIKMHGVNVLLYHGQSLDEVFRQLQSARVLRPSAGIQALLKARHVAPTYGGATALAPEREDLLIIDPVPDIMHCGHTGLPDEDVYRGTLLLSTPSWVDGARSASRSQGRAALVDLSTFEVLWRA